MSVTKASLRGFSRRELVNALISVDARIEAKVEAEAKKAAEAHEAEQRQIEADEERAHKARLSAIRRGELRASDVKRLVRLVMRETNGWTEVVLRLESNGTFADECQREIDQAIIDAIERGAMSSGGLVVDSPLGGWGAGVSLSPKDRTFPMNGSGS